MSTAALRLNGLKFGPNDFRADVMAYGAKGDGVADDTAAIQAAINAAAGKGPVVFPSGTYNYTNLSLVDGTKLWGTGFLYNTEAGAVLKRTSNVAGITAAGTSVLSAGTHLQLIELKDLYLDGGGFSADHVQFKYVSQALIERCFFTNAAGRHVFFGEVYDSRVNNNAFEFGGTSDGVTELFGMDSNENGYEFCNQIMFFQNRFETYRGTAIRVSGSNTNELWFSANKFESTISNQTPIILNGVTASFFDGIEITTFGTAGNTIAEMVQMNNCTACAGTFFFEQAPGKTPGVNAATLTEYMTLTTCIKCDFYVQVYDANLGSVTNAVLVKQTTCDNVSVRGIPGSVGGIWAKELTDQPAVVRALQGTFIGIGTAQTAGLTEQNSTAAANGAQQWSPTVLLKGNGWDTGVAGSVLDQWLMQVQPAQSNPAVNWFRLMSSENGSGFTTRFSINQFGGSFAGSLSAGGNISAPNMAYSKQSIAAAASITLNPGSGWARIALSATAITSLTVSAGTTAGQLLIVEVVQDATGGRSIPTTWTNVRFAGGTYTATATLNKIDCLTFIWDDTAAAWIEKSRSMNT